MFSLTSPAEKVGDFFKLFFAENLSNRVNLLKTLALPKIKKCLTLKLKCVIITMSQRTPRNEEMEGKGMKVYVVWLDSEREFASDKWLEAKARYQQLADGFGEDRVDMTVEYI